MTGKVACFLLLLVLVLLSASLLLLASLTLLLLMTLLLSVFFSAFFGCQLLLASLLLLTPSHIVAVFAVEDIPAVAMSLLLQGFCYCKVSAIAWFLLLLVILGCCCLPCFCCYLTVNFCGLSYTSDYRTTDLGKLSE
jgi:hypothetical protein